MDIKNTKFQEFQKIEEILTRAKVKYSFNSANEILHVRMPTFVHSSCNLWSRTGSKN